ncbi:hypothetical protein PHET_11557 [Paragonimus heterotremus]|uniref:Uncharacterized protein n=1 Tax=Paragonimus heterotremus TaxID=100268 RepID=A0A8J4WCL5_9TREM|nr:hypothetical protein PHET_11557 [Paragonimus heterotremus]
MMKEKQKCMNTPHYVSIAYSQRFIQRRVYLAPILKGSDQQSQQPEGIRIGHLQSGLWVLTVWKIEDVGFGTSGGFKYAHL